MKLVSMFTISVRTNAISFRVFSNMRFGSSDSQRRQFGAITIAKLLASILVTAAFSAAANTYKQTMGVDYFHFPVFCFLFVTRTACDLVTKLMIQMIGDKDFSVTHYTLDNLTAAVHSTFRLKLSTVSFVS